MVTLPGKYMTVCVLLMDSVRRGVRYLADPIGFDSANPEDPMSQLVMLALTKRNELMQSVERPLPLPMPMPMPVPLPPAKAEKIGRPCVVDPSKPAYAAQLRDHGFSISEIVQVPGITRSSLHGHLPTRPPDADRREPAELLRDRPLHGLVVRPAFQAL